MFVGRAYSKYPEKLPKSRVVWFAGFPLHIFLGLCKRAISRNGESIVLSLLNPL